MKGTKETIWESEGICSSRSSTKDAKLNFSLFKSMVNLKFSFVSSTFSHFTKLSVTSTLSLRPTRLNFFTLPTNRTSYLLISDWISCKFWMENQVDFRKQNFQFVSSFIKSRNRESSDLNSVFFHRSSNSKGSFSKALFAISRSTRHVDRRFKTSERHLFEVMPNPDRRYINFLWFTSRRTTRSIMCCGRERKRNGDAWHSKGSIFFWKKLC